MPNCHVVNRTCSIYGVSENYTSLFFTNVIGIEPPTSWRLPQGSNAQILTGRFSTEFFLLRLPTFPLMSITLSDRPQCAKVNERRWSRVCVRAGQNYVTDEVVTVCKL